MNALNKHKTKWLGIVTIVLGALQVDPNLKTLLPEKAYVWLQIVVGIGVLVCGFLNTWQEPAPPPTSSGQGGFSRMSMLLVTLTVGLLLTLSGCAGLKAAYQEADRPDEYAYVLAEHYAALVKQAADLKEKPTTPAYLVTTMQNIDKRAKPVVTNMRSLRDAYIKIDSAENEEALQKAVDEAVLLVAELARAVKAAGGEQ